MAETEGADGKQINLDTIQGDVGRIGDTIETGGRYILIHLLLLEYFAGLEGQENIEYQGDSG